MPDTIEAINARLSHYGLTHEHALAESLVVPSGKQLTISVVPSGQNGQVKLTPKTLDDVKRWIGVPDAVARRHPKPPTLATATAAPTRSIRELRDIAHVYVHGDSSTVQAHKAELAQILPNDAAIYGIFVLKDVDVLPDAVLAIDSGVRVFFANHFRIWKGGKVKLGGDIKFDCATMVGKYEAATRPVVSTGLKVGKLSDAVGG